MDMDEPMPAKDDFELPGALRPACEELTGIERRRRAARAVHRICRDCGRNESHREQARARSEDSHRLEHPLQRAIA